MADSKPVSDVFNVSATGFAKGTVMPAPSTQKRQSASADHGAAGPPDSPPPLQLNTSLNGRDCRIPMDARWGAYSSLPGAADLVRSMGGFQARLSQSTRLTVRISLMAGAEALRVQRRFSALAGDFLQIGMDASPDGAPPGCIPALRVRDHGNGLIDVDLYIENADVPGRLCLEAAAYCIALPLACLAECKSAPTIQVLYSEVEQVRVTCRVDIRDLAGACAENADTPELASLLVGSALDDLMRRFGSDSHRPLLAAQHNDQVLDAASAAARALGLDPRRFELAARAHTTRWGSCEPLAKWRKRERELIGQVQIPLDTGLANTVDIAAGISEHAPTGPLPSDLALQVASVALAASLSFLQRELLGEPSTRRRENLLPPPPLEHSRNRSLRQLASEKVSSESGVRPAIQTGRGAFVSRAS
jgi:hypothetical protein